MSHESSRGPRRQIRRGIDRQMENEADAGVYPLPLIDQAGVGGAPSDASIPAPSDEQITIPPDGKAMEQQPDWRKDFPIDWPRDTYVARRDFAKFMVLTSLAFVAGQIYIGVANAVRRGRGDFPIRKIIAVKDLPVGEAQVFNYPSPNDACLLLHPEPGKLLAFSQICTHLSCAVVPNWKENELYCPCHDGHFDMSTGRPIAGPPRRPLARIKIEVRQGTVYATGVEWRTV